MLCGWMGGDEWSVWGWKWGGFGEDWGGLGEEGRIEGYVEGFEFRNLYTRTRYTFTRTLPQKRSHPIPYPIPYPIPPTPLPNLPTQRPKRSPSLRNPHRQRTRRQKNTQTPENRDEPKGIVRVRVPAIFPQGPETGRLLGIHVGAEFAQAVGVDGELAVGDAFVGEFAVGGPVQEEVVLHFEAVGVGVGGGGGEFGEERAGVGGVVGCLVGGWGGVRY